MPGYDVCVYLGGPDYDRFYELFHAMSETILSTCVNIHGYCQMIQHLTAQDPEIFPDADAAAQLEAFTIFAKEFGVAMHRFYWPHTGEDSQQNRVLNMDRWKPYDAAAWDDMLAQMITVLEPLVQSALGYYETMISYPLGPSPRAENVQQLLKEIGRYLDKLSRRCEPGVIEYFLFHSGDDEDYLSPYGNI
jgi:hypothetical protein